MKGIAALLVVVCLVSGCTTAQIARPVAASAGVRTAQASTAKASLSAAQVKTSLATAAAAAAQIEGMATAEQKPVIAELSGALSEARAELEQTQTELSAASVSLEVSAVQVKEQESQLALALQGRHEAEEKTKTAEAALAFWRATAAKLSLLCVAGGIWIFRKPLLALCGVPTL